MNNLPNELVDKVKEYVVFKPKDYEEIRSAVKNWVIENEDALEEYGHISTWDTSLITNMSGLFHFDESDIPYFEQYEEKYFSINEFNDNISEWDVSNVTNMSYMFYKCIDFNQPLNNWNVSKVEDMTYMFNKSYTFNQPLDNWDVSSVLNMTKMFYNASDFNQNLSMWNLEGTKCDLIFESSGMNNENKPKII